MVSRDRTQRRSLFGLAHFLVQVPDGLGQCGQALREDVVVGFVDSLVTWRNLFSTVAAQLGRCHGCGL
jgi:hypothetical protein